MPTSETGPRTSRRPPAAGGFTLLEIIVVVAIIALLLVMVRISLPDRAADRFALEASRFVQALNDCRDSAVLSGAPAGIRIAPSRYELERYRRSWQALGDEGRRRLPADLALRVPLRPAVATASMPDVVCLPTGETALPAVRLTHGQTAGFYEFRDGPDGRFLAAWVEPPT